MTLRFGLQRHVRRRGSLHGGAARGARVERLARLRPEAHGDRGSTRDGHRSRRHGGMMVQAMYSFDPWLERSYGFISD